MADTTYTTKCYLKGSVQTSIDNSGNITKNFTWMVLNANETNTLLEWLAFQDYVETEWAGKSGDNWKKPVQQAGSKECTAFDSTDDSFIVADLTIETPPGRTHVEVTYTCTGNPNKIKHFTDGVFPSTLRMSVLSPSASSMLFLKSRLHLVMILGLHLIWRRSKLLLTVFSR